MPGIGVNSVPELELMVNFNSGIEIGIYYLKRNWIGIEKIGIEKFGIGIDQFYVELELTKRNSVELELAKWNWPYVWFMPYK